MMTDSFLTDDELTQRVKAWFVAKAMGAAPPKGQFVSSDEAQAADWITGEALRNEVTAAWKRAYHVACRLTGRTPLL